MFEKFYEKYTSEEQEALVLIRKVLGAGAFYNDWCMSAGTLGMVFCADGRAEIRRGRLEWPVTDKERKGVEAFSSGTDLPLESSQTVG